MRTGRASVASKNNPESSLESDFMAALVESEFKQRAFCFPQHHLILPE
jgi:hypothetical protein